MDQAGERRFLVRGEGGSGEVRVEWSGYEDEGESRGKVNTALQQAKSPSETVIMRKAWR
jgi:hypothetical protein